jgi:hypothetical protein
VQHHPRQRTTLTALTVHPALGLALYQTSRQRSREERRGSIGASSAHNSAKNSAKF